MIKNTIYCIALLLCFSAGTFAQQSYSPAQITGLPMHYIPSFAGNIGSLRLANETQSFNEKGYYKELTTFVSVDGFIPKLSSGLGAYIGYNDQRNKYSSVKQQSKMVDLGLVFAPKISIKGKYTLSPAISVNANIYEYYSEAYSYPITSDWNLPYDTLINVPAGYTSKYQMTEKLSLLFNSKKMYIGAAFNTQLENLTSWNILVQAGATFQRTDESKFSFSPSVIWQSLYSRSVLEYYLNNKLTRNEHRFVPSNVNLNFRYQKVLFGVGYYGFMAGFQHKNFRIQYSANGYLTRNTITLRLLLNTKNSNRINY